MTPSVLSRRALNRALLARQLLIERANRPVAEAIEHLVGLQSQAPDPPYIGLWSRLAGFRPGQLADLIAGRQVVRIALMRGTVHLVTASDALILRPLLQPVLVRGLAATAFGRNVKGIDHREIAAAGHDALGAGPLPPGEIGRRLSERWPDTDPESLTYAARCFLPLVQVPPRGLWGQSGRTTYAHLEDWVGRPVAAGPSLDELVTRYLAAFGPATVVDIQKWSGLTHLGEVIRRLRPSLRTFADEAGRPLFDVADAPLPDPETPAPVRLIAEWDNLLLAHAERSRIFDDSIRRRFMTQNGIVKGTVLVDGFVSGTWRIERTRDRVATAVITPFAADDTEAAVAEAERLLAFTDPGAEARRVEIRP